jgi:hypothetical protein
MAEVRVTSWNDLQDKLFEGAWRDDIRRFRSSYVFRGSSSTAHRLETSLRRLGGNYAEMEPHILRNFRKYAHQNFVEQNTLWHWLSLAQHHGLPTRLLDWTVSPFVAAHFATAVVEMYDHDGIVWAVNQKKVQEYLPELLRAELQREGADYFTADMLAQTVPSFNALDSLGSSLFVAYFEPPSMDDRITNQYALFSVMPDPQASLDDWLGEHPDLLLKIILPAEMKWEIRDRLDQINITERVLFPGLDGLSAWLKRYYTPRTG